MCLTSGSDNEQTTAIPSEKKLAAMLNGKKLIYCTDAEIGSHNIRNFNSMGTSVFNDCDYRLLSSDQEINIADMKAFDKNAPENKKRYQDKTYKIIPADKAMDLGFHEEKGLKNGRARKVKSKAVVHQKLSLHSQ